MVGREVECCEGCCLEEALLDAGSTRSSQAALLQVQSSERLQGNNTCNTFAGTTLALVLAEPENGRDRQAEGGAHTRARTHTHTHTRHTDTQAEPMHILHRCTHAHAHTRTHTPSTMALKPASPKLPFPGERTWIVWLCLSISQNSARSSAKVRAGDTRSTTRKCSTMNPQRQRKNTHTHTHTHKGEEGGRREGEQAQMKTRANSNAQPFLPQTNLG